MQYVVLLRGINLGSRNRVSMPDLRDALEKAGFGEVRTHLQSGNVVLAHDKDAADVEKRVRKVLTKQFDLDVDVIVRDEDELRAIVKDNPLKRSAKDGSLQFVVFCNEPHDPALLPEVAKPEKLVARDRELHVWCPKGVRDGKVMGALGRKPPAPVTTFRNWNTVAKLAEMVG